MTNVVSRPPQSDEAAAAMASAEAHLLGLGCAPDNTAALEAVKEAARLGHEDGRRAWAYFTAAGIGCVADQNKAVAMLAELSSVDRFAAVQHAFLQHVTCERKLAAVELRVISKDPYIAILPKLFSDAECRYMMVVGTPWLTRSSVLDLNGNVRFDDMSRCVSHARSRS